MTHLRVDSVTAVGRTVRAGVSCSRDLRRFFPNRTFEVEYAQSVEDVPERVLVIPVLAQACPAVWTRGGDVYVDVIDASFHAALYEVQATLREMYPRIIEGGDVIANRVEQPAEPRRFDGTGMLFTGGVDSVATYVRHREADPTLITVRGWLLRPDEDERWARVKRRVTEFADTEGCESTTIETDLHAFPDHGLLNAHYKRHTDGAWYSAVGHGLGLLGLCAPLAYARDIGTLHIAGSHWEGFRIQGQSWEGKAIPWGSHPSIDDEVRWTETGGHYDGFDLTRQDKLEVIADFVREHRPDLQVRACTRDELGGNCSRCEKCLRTIVGLALAGLDPNDHGFSASGGTLEHCITQFEEGNWVLDAHTVLHWKVLAANVPPDHDVPIEGSTAFFEWIEEVSFDDLLERSRQSMTNRTVRAIARRAPYSTIGPLRTLYDLFQ
jgi:hypothetical protein